MVHSHELNPAYAGDSPQYIKPLNVYVNILHVHNVLVPHACINTYLYWLSLSARYVLVAHLYWYRLIRSRSLFYLHATDAVFTNHYATH